MRYHRSSDIPRIFIMFVVLLLMLAFKIIFSISVIIILVSAAIFIISCGIILFNHFVCSWMLWLYLYYLIFWWYRIGRGRCSYVVVVGDLRKHLLRFELFYELLKWDFTSLFIGFDSKSLSNSLQLPLLYEATLFLQSIDCVHLCSPSSILYIVSFFLIFYASILLQLHISLLY